MRHGIGSIRRCRRPRIGRGSGALRRGLILLALLSWGCSPVTRAFDPAARTIRLREAPVDFACSVGTAPAACALLLKADWEALVIDYKAKCLQLGGAPVACQTAPPAAEVQRP